MDKVSLGSYVILRIADVPPRDPGLQSRGSILQPHAPDSTERLLRLAKDLVKST